MSSDQHPPSRAQKFLRFFLKPELWEEVSGDLDEQFYTSIRKGSSRKAYWIYWLQVLHYLRPFAVRKLINTPSNLSIMYQHNLLIGWRTIRKNKLFSIINIGGLALGMAVTILITLWIKEEISYDRFHKNYSNIYQVIANRDFNGNIFTDRNMVFPLARFIDEEIPQVDHAVWMTHGQTVQFTDGITITQQRGHQVGGPFFDLLNWTFIHGNASTALNDPTNIVLTRSMADIYFKGKNPVGKTIRILQGDDLTVAAVVEDPPANSSISFDFIRPFDIGDPGIKKLENHWNNYSWNILISTEDHTNMKSIDAAITDIMERHTENSNSTYFTHPLKDWHLRAEFNAGINSGGLIQYLQLFGLVAAIILIIACINFMNLSTARSSNRATEIAVRKTLGSNRSQLIQQFFFETIILTLFAFVLAIISVYLVLPYFNLIAESNLTLDLFDPSWWLVGLVIILLVGMIAGSYPALYLSGFKPVSILKGAKPMEKQHLPRGILVVFQFVASIALISGTLIVFEQINHVKSRDVGYDPDNLIMIPGRGDILQEYEVIKNELLASGRVQSVTRTRSPITQIWWRSPAPNWPGRPPETDILFSGMTTGFDFVKTMGISMQQGRDFTGTPGDTASVLLNEAAVKAMQLEDPIGKQIEYGDPFTIIGIMENAIMESPYEQVSPLMVFYAPDDAGYIHVRLADNVGPVDALAAMETIFTEVNPDLPFEYEFVDEEFGKKFAHEERISKIIGAFAAIAIFICCLGLLGMATFTVQKRTREIAVRKVLGASVSQVLILISRDFIKLVLIALIIAGPVTYLIAKNWLENYEYRIALNPLLFLLVGAFVVIISLSIVCVNALQKARANPVLSLHDE